MSESPGLPKLAQLAHAWYAVSALIDAAMHGSIPAKWTVILAGGAVRDLVTVSTAKPKDWDFYVVFANHHTDEECEALSDRIQDRFPAYLEGGAGVEPYLIGTWQVPNVGETQIMVRREPRPGMTTYAERVHWLVSEFDLTISQWAFHPTFGVRHGDNPATLDYIHLVTSPPRFPVSTLRRMYRFSERYGLRIRQDDLVDTALAAVKQLDPEKLVTVQKVAK